MSDRKASLPRPTQVTPAVGTMTSCASSHRHTEGQLRAACVWLRALIWGSHPTPPPVPGLQTVPPGQLLDLSLLASERTAPVCACACAYACMCVCM